MKYISIDEVEIPSIGLGTWPFTGRQCFEAVSNALDIGYRHIDTAQMYDNEEVVGRAIKKSGIDREDIFLVTKIHPNNLSYNDVTTSVKRSLKKLNTYIDLLLIHSPSMKTPIEETIDAMNELQQKTDIKNIGVSNFSIKQMKEAINASNTPILTNQIKYNPFRKNTNILDFCQEQNIMLTAYSPLAKSRTSKNDTINKISKKYNKTPQQVTLRWLIQQKNVSAIPRSSNRQHQKENIEIFDFNLNKKELKQISNID